VNNTGRILSPGVVIVAGAVMEICFLAFYFVSPGPGEVLLFIGVNSATFLILSWLLWRMRSGSVRPGRALLLPVAAFGVLFRLTLVPHGVVGSDDIYRYLWDGKVDAAGMNPFSFTPTDPHLAYLATPDLPSKVNHPELKSVYPALAQLLFLLSHVLFGDSVPGMKLLLVVMDCVTLFLLWRFVREREDPVVPLLLYAWSPLPVLYFALDGHIDALGIPFLVLALLLLTKQRAVRGAVALGLSALAKLVPLIVLPLVLRDLKGRRRFVFPALTVLIVVAGAALYYEPSWGVVESLLTFGSRWEFNGSIFSVAYFLTGSNEAAHIVSGVLILIVVGGISLLDRPLMEKVFWGFAGFLFLSPVVHPWYCTWLAALVALRWSPAAFVFLGTTALANVVVYRYRADGAWVDQPFLLLCEYLPVAVLLVREVIRGEVLTAGRRHTPFNHKERMQ
jgi:alpha-1,6-mannosyltransferase